MQTPQQARKAVKYLVKEKSLIGNEIFEAGAEAMYDGLPAENLEPLCDVGRARYQEYLVSNAERIAKLNADYPPAPSEEIIASVLAALRDNPNLLPPPLKASRPTDDR